MRPNDQTKLTELSVNTGGDKAFDEIAWEMSGGNIYDYLAKMIVTPALMLSMQAQDDGRIFYALVSDNIDSRIVNTEVERLRKASLDIPETLDEVALLEAVQREFPDQPEALFTITFQDEAWKKQYLSYVADLRHFIADKKRGVDRRISATDNFLTRHKVKRELKVERSHTFKYMERNCSNLHDIAIWYSRFLFNAPLKLLKEKKLIEPLREATMNTNENSVRNNCAVLARAIGFKDVMPADINYMQFKESLRVYFLNKTGYNNPYAYLTALEGQAPPLL